MVNICFIANYYKTIVFVEITKILIQHGITIYWIVPNNKQYQDLKKIFSKDQLLYIGKNEVLKAAENNCDYDLKINELIYGDRVLSLESKKWTYLYLSHLKHLYYDFIKQNNIKYVFGEVTWAHELIAHRLTIAAKDLECKYLNPHTIRIPNGRFAFFTDEFQSKIKEVYQEVNTAKDSIKIEKPSYLLINNNLLAKKGTLRYNLIKVKNFVLRTNQDANDPTLYSNPSLQFKIRVKEIYNRLVFNNFVSETSIDDLPQDKTCVLFTLHKQPEASIDVIGRYYENQLEMILNIWRVLPENYALLIKEHSNAIGDRGFKFYRKINALPSTYLVDNKEDSYKLLERCEVVFTVSGTIGYEASLKEIRAFTFAPTFFNKLKGCNEVSWKDFKSNTLTELIATSKIGLGIDEFSEWLLTNSFEGIMSDAYGDPRCMEEENIRKLSEAFLKIIK